MAHDDEYGQHERIFTLSEANHLIPQLNSATMRQSHTLIATGENR